MPLKGTLKIGQSYKITIDSDPATPGVTATVLAWVPPPGTPPLSPVVDAVAPGTQVQHAGTVPRAQALLVDCDLPDATTSKITITVLQSNTVIASGTESGDREWSFLVVP